MEQQPPIISLKHIRKVFDGNIVANADVSLAADKGTIHAIIGENGAGKSTLMNILYGLYQPDSGAIILRDILVKISSPADGIKHGLGMVTQHTTMIPALTVLENIILGAEPSKFGLIDTTVANADLKQICRDLTIDLPLNTKCESISVASLQKAEIVKAIFRGAEIFILDEPTATLSPTEATILFSLLKEIVAKGSTVIFITHKMSEVMDHSDNVTVLRSGRSVGQFKTSETTPANLLQLMIGDEKELTRYSHKTQSNPFSDADTVLSVNKVCTNTKSGLHKLSKIDLRVHAGEIVGIAGVDGSGQHELASVIVGLMPIESGTVTIAGVNATQLSTNQRLSLGLGYIPEDRQIEGLVLDFDIAENMILGRESFKEFGGGRLLDQKMIAERGDLAVIQNKIRAHNGATITRSLSGGNQQKVVIARALSGKPKLIIAMQPTRGLDAEATQFVYTLFENALKKGAGIILFSLDLDEILALSDRVSVMFNGGIQGVLERNDATIESIGALMVGGLV